MSGLLTGGCQCGAVRYHAANGLTNLHLCHCRMCQKAAGNYFMPLGGSDRTDFTVTRGRIGWFNSSEPVRRGFCGKCGTPLVFDVLASDQIDVTLGSLDQPELLKPDFQTGLDTAMPWFGDLSGLAKERDPPEWYAKIARSNHQHPDHDTENWPPKEHR